MNAAVNPEAHKVDLTLAVQNAGVLRTLESGEADVSSIKGFAAAVGRDASNVSKSLQLLEKQGWITRDPLALTEAGRALVGRLDVLEGFAPAPASDLLQALHVQLLPDPFNPRRDWSSDEAIEDLDALRQDIVQHSLLQNLVVRPDSGDVGLEVNGVRLPLYRIVSGERRWRAIGLAIEDGDWAADRSIAIKLHSDRDDMQHQLVALAENLQRRALTPIEEARAFKRLADGKPPMPTAEIADRVSVTQRQVQHRLKLLELSNEDQARMELPKEDPQHLTAFGARALLQTARPLERPNPAEEPGASQLHLGSDDAPEQRDIEEVAPAPQRSRLDGLPEGYLPFNDYGRRRNGIPTTPRLLMAIVELADKCIRDPDPTTSSDRGSTRIRPGAPRSGLDDLAYMGGGFHYFQGRETAILGRDLAAWLRQAGLYPEGAAAPEILRKVRTDAVGAKQAAEAEAGSFYITPCLNLHRAQAEAEQSKPAPPPAKPTASADPPWPGDDSSSEEAEERERADSDTLVVVKALQDDLASIGYLSPNLCERATALFKRAGITLPLQVGGHDLSNVLIDDAGEWVASVDPDGDFTDPRAEAIARLLLMATSTFVRP